MHINSEFIKSAEFVQEQKPERISFSIRFFEENGDRILAAFFTNMYDESKKLISERKKDFDQLNKKYASKIQF
jgi:putative heme iron utilization protein